MPLLFLFALTACDLGSPNRVVLQTTETLEVGGAVALDLLQDRGDTEILVAADDTVRLFVELRGPEDDERDERAKEALTATLERVSDQILADSTLSIEGYTLFTRLELPADLALQVEDASGDLAIAGIQSVRVKDGSGAVEISDAGDVEVVDNSGALTLTRIDGDLTLDDDSGEITVLESRGAIDLRDGSGDITISDHVGDIQIVDDSGDITLENIQGEVGISDGSGDIRYSDVDELDIYRDDSGSVSGD